MRVRLAVVFWLAAAAAASAQPPGDNPEIAALFAEDQNVRSPAAFAAVDGAVLARQDAQRRSQAHALLASNALQTGTDFERAAFIFQHGDTPADYLLAHILANLAVAKGKASALWISAATLDRYLLSIGQNQVLGTQFHTESRYNPANQSTGWTQAPYDRELVSDALRAQLGVPPLAEQARQLSSLQGSR